MKILIVADTHLTQPEAFTRVLSDQDLPDYVIHAGDYVDIGVLNSFKEKYNFIGVYGNNDDSEIVQQLYSKEIIEFPPYKIGIFHGDGQGKSTIERTYEQFKTDDVDIVVFGHSHQPLILTKDKMLFLNPGSPTNKRKERWFSYIMLELLPEMIKAELRLFR